MSDSKVIKETSAGSRVAENETDGLKKYFQKTYIWDGIIENETDVIFGCKGSGKSALYNYLTSSSNELFEQDVLLVPAVNPRGGAAFKDLKTNPPTGEVEFNHIWKLYFILILVNKLMEFKYDDAYYKEVVQKLQESNLMPRSFTFPSMLRMVRDYLLNFNPQFEPKINFNEVGGLDSYSCNIVLSEPSTAEADKGIVSINYLYDLINKSLAENGNRVWISIDRLDVVFLESLELEVNALRALFKVYVDLFEFENIRLIIFLRDDIWNRIIEKGFRELSHITKHDDISWDEDSLFNLLMSRLIENEALLKFYKLKKKDVKKSKGAKLNLFNNIFEETVTSGDKRHSFKWMISMLTDGNGNCSPRELIHLTNESIKAQKKKLQDGEKLPSKCLIGSDAIKIGFRRASKLKYDTVISEYPGLSIYLHRLKKKKVRLRINDLKEAWGISKKDSRIIAKKMIDLGIFKLENDNQNEPELLVPFLYRPALGMY